MANKKLIPSMAQRPAPFHQALEKRFMFDAAAIATVEKGFDLSHGVDHQEQLEVLAALAANHNVIATQSLFTAIGDSQAVNENYTNVKEVIFIDSTVQDPEEIIAGITRGAAVEIIGAGQDGVAEIASLLQKYHNLDAIHIISHGGQGELFLGDTTLNMQTLGQHSAEIASWNNALAQNGDILLYGCNVAEGSIGSDFVFALAQVTSADIAASTDNTGGLSQGGNWDLESHNHVDIGSIIDDPGYDHSLNIAISHSFTSQTSILRTVNGVPTLISNYYSQGSAAENLYDTLNFKGDPVIDHTIHNISVTINNVATGDVLSIRSDSSPNNSGAVSTVGSNIYIGTGSGTQLVGDYSYTGGVLQVNFNTGYLGDNTQTYGTQTITRAIVQHVTFINSSPSLSSGARNITLSVTQGVNDTGSSPGVFYVVGSDQAPTLSATDVNPSYIESSDTPVTLFSAASASTIESAQTFTFFDMTVDNAQSSDQLTIDGRDFALSDTGSTAITTTNGLSITSTHSGGSWVLLVNMPNGLTHSQSITLLQNVVNGMTFKAVYPVVDTNSRTITLRTLRDSGSNTAPDHNITTLDGLTSTVSVTHDLPFVTASAYNPSFVEDSGSSIPLFFNATVTPLNNNERFSGLTFTLSNVSDSDTLSIDGSDLIMVDGSSINSTLTNGLTVTNSISGGLAHIQISGGDLLATQLQTLLNGLSFKTSSTEAIPASRVFTITSFTDNENTHNVVSMSLVSDITLSNGISLSSTALNPTFNEGLGTPVTLFNSTVGSAQTFVYFDMTISSAFSSDYLTIDGRTFALSDLNNTPMITANNLSITGSNYSAGSWAIYVSLPSMNHTSLENVINHIAFSAPSSNQHSDQRIISLRALRDHMNGSDHTTSDVNIHSTVSVDLLNLPPTMTADGSVFNYTINSNASIALFSNTSVSTIETGQTITGMTFVVSNVSSVDDMLRIDNAKIHLVDGESLFYSPGAPNNNLTAIVSITGTDATITISGSVSASIFQTIVNGIVFESTTESTSSKTVTITSLSDSGNNIYPSSNTASLSIVSTINFVEPINQPPGVSIPVYNRTFLSSDTMFPSVFVYTTLRSQRLTAMTLTVSSADATDIIQIEGVNLVLTNGSAITTAHVSASVSVTNGLATIAITGANFNHLDFDNFLQGFRYINTTSGYKAQRVVTITSLTDSGSNVFPNRNTASLNISYTINYSPYIDKYSYQSKYTNDSSQSALFHVDSTIKTDLTSLSTAASSSDSAIQLTDKVAFRDQKIDSILKEMAMAMKANPEKASEIASSIYEMAVKVTKETNTTHLLEEVVSAIISESKVAPKNFDLFLGKIANDSRLTIDEQTSVINHLIQIGNQSAAQALLQKMDLAVVTKSHDSSGKNENCSP